MQIVGRRLTSFWTRTKLYRVRYSSTAMELSCSRMPPTHTAIQPVARKPNPRKQTPTSQARVTKRNRETIQHISSHFISLIPLLCIPHVYLITSTSETGLPTPTFDFKLLPEEGEGEEIEDPNSPALHAPENADHRDPPLPPRHSTPPASPASTPTNPSNQISGTSSGFVAAAYRTK